MRQVSARDIHIGRRVPAEIDTTVSGIDRNESTIERGMVVAAEWETVSRVARATLRVTRNMSGMQPLGNRAVADYAVAPVSLDDLNPEPLLVRAAARQAEDLRSILEQLERFVIDCVTSSDANWQGAKLYEEQLLVIIPGRNPSFAHGSTRALLQNDEQRKAQITSRFRGLDFGAISAYRAAGLRVVVMT